MNAAPVVISVSGLLKKYGNHVAVDGVSFDVYKGEIFGLLGPNGAGKTTTLEIMETLRDATAGTVTVEGHNVAKEPSTVKKLIGVQLQAAGYYPNLTLKELIRLFSGLYNQPTDPDKLLRMVGLEEKAKARYKELSGGQKQRFSIATTLINKPSIVFLDEPTTGLDPQARRNLWELISKVRNEGATVVLTTHYMDEAEELCDRVAIMEKGQIIALDKPDVLIDQLIAKGFERKKEVKQASLEDVFIELTGHEWRNDK
jgi:ABC-2 type transport system ATP-binding protein